jgi:uncharacterized repeat protein (TIGR03803 family)
MSIVTDPVPGHDSVSRIAYIMKPESRSVMSKERKCSAHLTKGIKKQWCAYALALSVALAVLVPQTAQAQHYTESVLYSFAGGTDGTEPLFSGVIRDPAGNLYGTTYSGGASNYGTVFKVDTSGNETVLYSFTGRADGRTPYAGLVRDPAGRLYGTTYNGGLRSAMCTSGCGVVFEVDPNGDEKVLHRFTGGTDGALPIGGLIRDAAGNLYGTTQMGGASGSGTVFKLDATGVETVLYSFAGVPDGQYPFAGVIRDSAGNLYGTTSNGGAIGFGTVFKLDAAGHETVLYSFTGGSDGGSPQAPLLRDNNGDLYGTTFLGGANYGVGTVFEVDASGNETVLHNFAGNDGKYPEAGLIRDSQGNLYGSALQGGPADNLGGNVFKISRQGTWSVLYNFTGGPDGGNPAGSLLMDSAGNLYGTTASGGVSGRGTVFKLAP